MILGVFGPHLGEWPDKQWRSHPQITFNVRFRPFDNDLGIIRFYIQKKVFFLLHLNEQATLHFLHNFVAVSAVKRKIYPRSFYFSVLGGHAMLFVRKRIFGFAVCSCSLNLFVTFSKSW